MEAIDVSHIDSSTTIGQVAVLLVTVSALVATVKPLIGGARKNFSNRNYNSVAEELKVSRREISYQKKVSTSMREWELTAREAIRVMQNELVEAGAGENPQIARLLELLEDNETRRSKFIVEELTRDESE